MDNSMINIKCLNHLVLKHDLDLIIKKEISKPLMDMKIKQDLNQTEKNINILLIQ